MLALTERRRELRVKFIICCLHCLYLLDQEKDMTMLSARRRTCMPESETLECSRRCLDAFLSSVDRGGGS